MGRLCKTTVENAKQRVAENMGNDLRLSQIGKAFVCAQRITTNTSILNIICRVNMSLFVILTYQ